MPLCPPSDTVGSRVGFAVPLDQAHVVPCVYMNIEPVRRLKPRPTVTNRDCSFFEDLIEELESASLDLVFVES